MITVENLQRMDDACDRDRKLRTFLGCVRLANLFHEDNQEEIAEVADRFGLSAEQLCQYAWLQMYIAELSELVEFHPIEEVAQEFGINFAEFEDYLIFRAEEIAIQKAAILMDCFPWETEESHLTDLLRDTVLQG